MMFSLTPVFALVLVSFSVSTAFAGGSAIHREGVAGLSECGGTLRVSEMFSGDLRLEIRDVRNCSQVQVTGGFKHIDGKLEPRVHSDPNGPRESMVVVPRSMLRDGRVEVSIRSRSGKTEDSITIFVSSGHERRSEDPITMTLGDEARLSSCGGTVEVNSHGDQVNLVFRHVENCSNFDILSSSGTKIAYEAKKLQGGPGNYSGSFTLPKRVVRDLFESFLGYNSVKVRVNSNSGAHGDVIIVKFFNW